MSPGTTTIHVQVQSHNATIISIVQQSIYVGIDQTLQTSPPHILTLSSPPMRYSTPPPGSALGSTGHSVTLRLLVLGAYRNSDPARSLRSRSVTASHRVSRSLAHPGHLPSASHQAQHGAHSATWRRIKQRLSTIPDHLPRPQPSSLYSQHSRPSPYQA